MAQHVKKRRTGWAIIAAAAMIASILAAVGTSPAAAGPQEADAQATWTACLGPATDDYGFTDVADTNTHATNINCLAYYGITTGTTATTYDPGAHVTRSQMALFLTRMADAAEIDLGESMDMGFTDLDNTGENRVQAINTLAAKNIMPGRTATTFDPTGTVTRADMALHLFRFLDLALDSVLIDNLPDSVENNKDGTGKIELNDDNGDGIGDRVNDYFGDVRRNLPAHIDDIVGAVYELGITNGTNATVGALGTFEPAEPVTRAQMASFIMRTLGHTNLRPEGLTAQQTRTMTQVSVRDADFKPVVNARVELFWSNFAQDAFDRSGRCIDRFVTDSDGSFDPCEIDAGDARTDVEGNVELEPGSGGSRPTITCEAGTPYAVDGATVRYRLEAAGLSDPDADYKLWAWMGDFGDTVNSGTDLFEAVPANQQDSRTDAVTAVFSGGTRNTVKMGSSLVYEIQLVDNMGRPVGPNPTGNQDYTVTIRKRAEGASAVTISEVQRRSPDSDGNIRIVVTHPDSVAGADNPDFDVSVEVRRYDATGIPMNTLRFVDTTGAEGTEATGFDAAGYSIAETTGTGPSDQRRFIGAQAPVERFSDNAPVATRIDVSPGAAGRVLAGRNQNSITVTVLDQYGNPFRGGAQYTATNEGPPTDSQYPGNANAASSGTLSSNSSGRVYFNYSYVNAGPSTETITIAATTGSGDASKIYWANISNPSSGSENLLLADPRTRHLFAGATTAPTAFVFGDDDSFLVGTGTALASLSLAQFQEVLMVANSSDPRITLNKADDGTITTQTTLDWEGFNNNRPNDSATWTLKGLHCTPPAGADAETYAL